MNISYTLVAAILLCLIDIKDISAQPIFLDTTSDSISLCTSDPGVRLPATNQLYLGEGHHLAVCIYLRQLVSKLIAVLSWNMK
ncbi:MAG: hypothetical protein M3R25_03385 [Bacteroidota bacterium]|nr:hypothetical protein [Bacteroidota bacterium]